jgi:hypothetical protein
MYWVPLLFLLAAGAGGENPVEQTRLQRFKEKVRQDLARVPNYTCLESIERFSRLPKTSTFQSIDTVRLEVSNVDGKELFAWPGARSFEDKTARSFVTGGTIGWGMFAITAHQLFLENLGQLRFHGAESLDGRRTVRYDFTIPDPPGALSLRTELGSALVAVKGSFWFDADSLDLIRIDEYGNEIPPNLGLTGAFIRVIYARSRIGAADALLPRQSELELTNSSGLVNRNITMFANCREYGSESSISFTAPPKPAPELPKPAAHEIDVPAGLEIPVTLETAIDSARSVVGDEVRGQVAEDVTIRPDLKLPKGAAVTGHIVALEHRLSPQPSVIVGIEFTEAEWGNARAIFSGELLDVDYRSPGMKQLLTYFDGKRKKAVIEHDVPPTGIFYMKGRQCHIAPGLRIEWRTLRPGK